MKTTQDSNYLDDLRDAARAGARVVGYAGNDIPVALIIAAGATPVRLRCEALAGTPRADQFLESAFSPELRSIVEQWLEGRLDFLESVVFARSDDSSQRVYYYLCELKRRGLCGGPRPLLYDVADIGRAPSSAYTRESTQRLAHELGTQDARLAAAVERVARRDALMAEVRDRRAAPAPLAGTLGLEVEQAGSRDWREDFDVATRSRLTTAPVLSAPRRIVLAGDPPADDTLHRAIESAGGTVVRELTESVSSPMAAQPPLIDAIADHFHVRRNPVREMRANGQWVVDCAREARAHAVVFWLIEEDEALPWEIARQMRSLAAARVPTLLLSRQPWRADERALKQVTDFVSGIEVNT